MQIATPGTTIRLFFSRWGRTHVDVTDPDGLEVVSNGELWPDRETRTAYYDFAVPAGAKGGVWKITPSDTSHPDPLVGETEFAVLPTTVLAHTNSEPGEGMPMNLDGGGPSTLYGGVILPPIDAGTP